MLGIGSGGIGDGVTSNDSTEIGRGTGSTESEMAREPVLAVNGLKVHFPIRQGLLFQRQVGTVKAVDDVSFDVRPGETLGLVGESGSGKTTIGRAILNLVKITEGEVRFEGRNIAGLQGADMRRIRRRLGVVFQDPYSSLNPRMPARSIIGEPLEVHRVHRSRGEYVGRIKELLELVGLNASMMTRYAHEFSGGQRQRIAVARAIAIDPKLVILDEPVSALDVSIQAQIINLLQDLQRRLNVAYLFIAHDLSVVRHISHRVAVAYLGKVVEIADRRELYARPKHPYTQALLSAVPVPSPTLERARRRIILAGDVPSPANPPSGCVFHTRCPIATDECKSVVPQLREVSRRHFVACLKADGYDVPAGGAGVKAGGV